MDRDKEILVIIDKLQGMGIPQLMGILGASQAFCLSQNSNKKETVKSENDLRKGKVN